MTVWVAGEALVDVLPGPTPDLLTPVPGGGPANTALALARLGVPVEFVGGLSQDSFGTNMAKQFQRDGVGLRHAVFNNLPTCLAMVSLDEKGTASYHFHIRGTATFEFDFQKLPIAPKPDWTPVTFGSTPRMSSGWCRRWRSSMCGQAAATCRPRIRAR